MTEDTNPTRDRLLDAAEHLFAQKGFDEVSIRELAAAAGVNVAAVNYHFQGKEKLYQEVIVRRFVGQRDRTVKALSAVLEAQPGPPSLPKVIQTMVTQYLEGALAAPEGPGFLMAVSREMHGHATPHRTVLFREMIAPVFAAFSEAIIKARPHLRPDQVTWIIASIVSQVHHFILRWIKKEAMDPQDEGRAIMLSVFPVLNEPLPLYIGQVTRHITDFSTAAVDGMFPEVVS